MDLDARGAGPTIRAAPGAAVILLDTHAAIWLAQGHRRAAPLSRVPRLHLSPISILEIQFLIEAGRLRLTGSRSASALADDERWRLDDPPASRWMVQACDVEWTRDPFDRLLVAHARLRDWRLATADALLIARLASDDLLTL